MLKSKQIIAECDTCKRQHTIMDTSPAQVLPPFSYFQRYMREMGWKVAAYGAMTCPECQQSKKRGK